MTLSVEMPVPRPNPKHTHIPIEETDELRATILRLTKENDESHQRLYKVTEKRDNLRYKLRHRQEELAKSQGTTPQETGKRQRIKHGLDTLGSKLSATNRRLKRAIDANKEWEAWWERDAEQES